jgi:hypothetical protein
MSDLQNNERMVLQTVFDALERVVYEFDTFGEVHQSGDDDLYGYDTAIGQARDALVCAHRLFSQEPLNANNSF